MPFTASALVTASVTDLVHYLQRYLPHYTYQYYFSTGVFVLSLLGGCYLLIGWLLHNKRDPLMVLWAIGLWLTYWIQIPAMLVNSGVEFTVTDLNLIFAIAAPLCFLGMLLIFAGIALRASARPPVMLFRMLSLWFLACALFFLYAFQQGSQITTYWPATVGAVFFFVPLLMLTFFTLIRLMRRARNEHLPHLLSGARYLMIGATFEIAAIVSGYFAVMQYPPRFWFIALLFSTPMLLLSTLATILLLFSFFLIRLDVHKQTSHGVVFTTQERSLIHHEFGIRIENGGSRR